MFAFCIMWDGWSLCVKVPVVLFEKTDSSVWFQGGMINWNRLFPPLRHRHNYQDHHPSDQDTPPPTEVSEEQVIFSFNISFKKLLGITSVFFYCLLTQLLNHSLQ